MMSSEQLDLADEIMEIIKQAPEIDRLISEAVHYEMGDSKIIFNKGRNAVKIEVTVFEFKTPKK